MSTHTKLSGEVVYCKDIMRILSCSKSKAYRMITETKAKTGRKSRHITVDEFAEQTGLRRERIMDPGGTTTEPNRRNESFQAVANGS